MADQTFRNLHQGSTPLLLANAWDAGTARLIESLGAKAVATTSAGFAWARGYADGNTLPVEQLIAATRDIARVIRVPLSIDIEGGYSDDPATVAQLAANIIDAGGVGINIEDGADDPSLLCRKIEAVRQCAARLGADLFINVRTDVYLRAIATGTAAVDEVIRRAELYRAAGCDGLFVPGIADGDAIAAIAAAINPLPLNIMLVPGLPSVKTLHQYGVRRFSAGSAIAQASLACTSRLAAAFLAGAGEEVFAVPSASYNALNRLFLES
jgi:2-methylisocitrate lyase-like PEP mutase family enzyme